MRELDLAIKKTKKYAKRYGQKLNDKQLYLRLISKNIYRYKEINGKGVGKNERGCWEKKVVLAKNLVNENFAKMNGIKMVGITGSVAAEASKRNEDIDLMFVIERDELWWWRLYLRFYIYWNNKNC